MISVVVPAYRESANVLRAVSEIAAALRALEGRHEIVIVDDGSPDDTYERAQNVTAAGVNVVAVRHAINRGPGAAFRTGFSISRGDLIVTIDCDLSFDPQQIGSLVAGLSGADVVVGAQHGRGAQMKNVPFFRVAGSKIIYIADRFWFGGSLGSYSSFF